ncbi:MAG: dodecin family protein [Candidatus Heimdallarchaeota archaeon]
MEDASIYKMIELVGTSPSSWEEAVQNVVDKASSSLRNMRIVEVVQLDAKIGENNKIAMYRAKVKLSFKFE